jgi:hypothetical protein
LAYPECSESYIHGHSVDGIASALIESMIASLKVASQEGHSCLEKKSQPHVINEFEKVMRDLNKNLYWLSQNTLTADAAIKIAELEHKLRSNIESKVQRKYDIMSEA